MGCIQSSSSSVSSSNVFSDISEQEFFSELNRLNIKEDCQIVLAIDATGSNDHSPYGPNYHEISAGKRNPYEQVIQTSVSLLKQDRDSTVPLYFFGSTQANRNLETPGVLYAGDYPNEDTSLLQAYRDSIKQQILDGPTDFRAIIRLVANNVRKTGNYTVLIIITDGAINSEVEQHIKLLQEISNLPLAITCIGIGQGDFKDMNRFDNIPGRVIDNFQFTEMESVCKLEEMDAKSRYFFYRSFMEVPRHYKKCLEVLKYQPKPNAEQVGRVATINPRVPTPPPEYSQSAIFPTLKTV